MIVATGEGNSLITTTSTANSLPSRGEVLFAEFATNY